MYELSLLIERDQIQMESISKIKMKKQSKNSRTFTRLVMFFDLCFEHPPLVSSTPLFAFLPPVCR